MAKTTHKIRIIKNGTSYTVPLFTSKDDLKNRLGRPIKVYDKTQKKVITLYYPIGETNDPERTPARIKDKDGNVYALLNTGTPPFTQVIYTVPKAKAGVSDYSFSFTVPHGVTRIQYALCPAAIYNVYHDGEETPYFTYHSGSDTTIGSGSSKISAQINGKKANNSFIWGCKASTVFTPRSGQGSSKTNYYSIPQRLTEYTVTNATSFPRNYFYSGYMNVEPSQKIPIVIGGKSGDREDVSTCGFVIINYGVGIEK